jgi:hypothetical protein
MHVMAKAPMAMGEVLGELGFSYIPDPMGRLFQGDWTRPEGPYLNARQFSDHVGRVILIADKDDEKKLRGSRNPVVRKAIEEGRKEHDKLRSKARGKLGWDADRLLRNEITGEKGRPDVITPRGRTMELKPDTPTGRKAAEKQTKKYNRITGQRSRPIFYRRPSGGGGLGGGGGGSWPRKK